jgi:hypothetical protein
MTICAVIDNTTNAQVNVIVAEPTDLAPDGCRLVEIPDGYFWNGTEMAPMEFVDGY